MPTSEKQLAANRANAAKSTGPSISPSTSQDLFALKQMALAQQTMFRAARLESRIFTPDLVGGGIEITQAQNCNYALAAGFHRLARKDNIFPLFLRYKVQTERLYRRAVEEFDRLKALRPELPNEPILEAQPEENAPTCAPPDEPISTPQPEPQAPNATGLSTSEDAARNILQDLDVPTGPDNFLVGQAVSPVTAGRSRRLVAARLLSGVDAVPDLPVEPSGRGTRAD